MKRYLFRAAVAFTVLAVCAGRIALCAEGDSFVVDSPFDLTLGSTNYAARLGKAVRSNASAWYDPTTKVTTTNWSAYASVRFAKPYHGATHASLQFKGEERELDSYSFEIGESRRRIGGTLTVEEARKIMQEVSDDISKRFGVEVKQDSGLGDDDLSDAEIDERIEEKLKKGDGKMRLVNTAFMRRNAHEEREGVGVGYGLTAFVDKNRKCSVHVNVYTSWRPSKVKSKPVGATAIPGLVSEEEQKKAHEESKVLRTALGKLFGIDFDSDKDDDRADRMNVPEWTAMESPVAGLDECKPNRSSSDLFQVPIVSYSARRAYPGDVEEAVLERQAKEVLERIVAAYGEKIPVFDAKDGQAELAKVLGEGVPTFGDSRALLGLDKVQTFVGKVGDLAVEIAYALPRYEKRGDDYRLVRRGTVILNITQSPIITPVKTLQAK